MPEATTTEIPFRRVNERTGSETKSLTFTVPKEEIASKLTFAQEQIKAIKALLPKDTTSDSQSYGPIKDTENDTEYLLTEARSETGTLVQTLQTKRVKTRRMSVAEFEKEYGYSPQDGTKKVETVNKVVIRPNETDENYTLEQTVRNGDLFATEDDLMKGLVENLTNMRVLAQKKKEEAEREKEAGIVDKQNLSGVRDELDRELVSA